MASYPRFLNCLVAASFLMLCGVLDAAAQKKKKDIIGYCEGKPVYNEGQLKPEETFDPKRCCTELYLSRYDKRLCCDGLAYDPTTEHCCNDAYVAALTERCDSFCNGTLVPILSGSIFDPNKCCGTQYIQFNFNTACCGQSGQVVTGAAPGSKPVPYNTSSSVCCPGNVVIDKAGLTVSGVTPAGDPLYECPYEPNECNGSPIRLGKNVPFDDGLCCGQNYLEPGDRCCGPTGQIGHLPGQTAQAYNPQEGRTCCDNRIQIGDACCGKEAMYSAFEECCQPSNTIASKGTCPKPPPAPGTAPASAG